MYLSVTIPVEAITAVSVIAPVVAFFEIILKPFSERTGPLKVVLAIWPTSLLKVSL
jgi:hypothetical protein